MPGSTRYVQVEALIVEFGFSRRQWLNQAAAGRVPGARQPFGPGTTWVFDIEAVRAWWAASERKPGKIRPQNDWRPEPRRKNLPAFAKQRGEGKAEESASTIVVRSLLKAYKDNYPKKP